MFYVSSNRNKILPLLFSLLARMIMMMRICVNWKKCNTHQHTIQQDIWKLWDSFHLTKNTSISAPAMREANRSMGEFFPSFLEEKNHHKIKFINTITPKQSQTKTWGHLLLEVKTMTVLFLKTIVSVMWSVNGVKLTLDYDAGQICTLIIMGTFLPFPFFPCRLASIRF